MSDVSCKRFPILRWASYIFLAALAIPSQAEKPSNCANISMAIRTPEMPNMYIARVACETSASFSATVVSWRALQCCNMLQYRHNFKQRRPPILVYVYPCVSLCKYMHVHRAVCILLYPSMSLYLLVCPCILLYSPVSLCISLHINLHTVIHHHIICIILPCVSFQILQKPCVSFGISVFHRLCLSKLCLCPDGFYYSFRLSPSQLTLQKDILRLLREFCRS